MKKLHQNTNKKGQKTQTFTVKQHKYWKDKPQSII